MRRTFVATIILFTPLILTNCNQRFRISTSAYIIGKSNDIFPLGQPDAKQLPKLQINGAVILSTSVSEKKKKFEVCQGKTVKPREEATIAIMILLVYVKFFGLYTFVQQCSGNSNLKFYRLCRHQMVLTSSSEYI